MITAFHSFWSKPNQARHQGRIIWEDFELLVMMLSALQWKKLYGPIQMITDSAGASFFEKNGLVGLWSEPVAQSLETIPKELDPVLFWAAGKLVALERMECPCVMLDTDVILWKKTPCMLGEEVVAAHAEELIPEVYPDPALFCFQKDYTFPEEWDFTQKAANTAFLYMPDRELRDYYVSVSLDFMKHLEREQMNPTVSMCFAEQRILPMCVKVKQKKIRYLLEPEKWKEQNFITHLWGYKRVLQGSAIERERFCVRCVRRLLSDFPEWEEMLVHHPTLKGYVKIALQQVRNEIK